MTRKALILITLLVCFMAAPAVIKAQSIELQQIEFVKNKLVIHYNLNDSIEGRSYSIRLYSSADGFLNAVVKTEGDVGLEVKPGKNKVIQWDVAQELGPTFEGKLAVEVRGRQFIPFINTEKINEYKVFKRKRSYDLTWSGGTPQNILNFDLMNGKEKVMSFPNIANVGHHTFEFPTYVKPGKNYFFKISDTKNKEEQVVTNTFRIRRKVPLVVKAIPVIAVGAVIYFIATKPSNSAESPIGEAPSPNDSNK